MFMHPYMRMEKSKLSAKLLVLSESAEFGGLKIFLMSSLSEVCLVLNWLGTDSVFKSGALNTRLFSLNGEIFVPKD